MKATYILHNNFDSGIERYKKELVSRVAEKFGLQRTLFENIHAHFTLKYWFQADETELAELENTLLAFSQNAKPSTVTIGEVRGFPPAVVFLNVMLSDESRQTFERLIHALRGLSWMTWDMYDAENLHPHQTIAEDCGELYSSVLDFLGTLHTSPLQGSFDNVTITKLIGVRDTHTVIETYKVFKFGLENK